MEIRQISISTPSIRIGIFERITGFIKTLPLDEATKKAKTLLIGLYKTIKLLIKQVLKLFVFLKNIILKVTDSAISSFNERNANAVAPAIGSTKKLHRRRLKLPSKKVSKALLIIVIAAIVLVGGSRLINSIRSAGGGPDKRQEVQGARASQNLNREFAVPLKNAEGEEVSKIRYRIEKAELRDEIIVKGQRATAVKGRTFLILTLKITNEHSQAIEIDTRDYMRLSVNGKGEEWLAPDIHNDPVEVQAISTKYTRLGFPINDNDKNLTLRVGEIDGEKEKINLDLN